MVIILRIAYRDEELLLLQLLYALSRVAVCQAAVGIISYWSTTDSFANRPSKIPVEGVCIFYFPSWIKFPSEKLRLVANFSNVFQGSTILTRQHLSPHPLPRLCKLIPPLQNREGGSEGGFLPWKVGKIGWERVKTENGTQIPSSRIYRSLTPCLKWLPAKWQSGLSAIGALPTWV